MGTTQGTTKEETVMREVGKSSGLERGSSADGRERGERERERERSILLVSYPCIPEGGLLCNDDRRFRSRAIETVEEIESSEDYV